VAYKNAIDVELRGSDSHYITAASAPIPLSILQYIIQSIVYLYKVFA